MSWRLVDDEYVGRVGLGRRRRWRDSTPQIHFLVISRMNKLPFAIYAYFLTPACSLPTFDQSSEINASLIAPKKKEFEQFLKQINQKKHKIV